MKMLINCLIIFAIRVAENFKNAVRMILKMGIFSDEDIICFWNKRNKD